MLVQDTAKNVGGVFYETQCTCYRNIHVCVSSQNNEIICRGSEMSLSTVYRATLLQSAVMFRKQLAISFYCQTHYIRFLILNRVDYPGGNFEDFSQRV